MQIPGFLNTRNGSGDLPGLALPFLALDDVQSGGLLPGFSVTKPQLHQKTQ